MVSLTGGSFSKNDLENSLSREELSPLIDDKNEQLPLTENFLRKRSSASSSKSPDKKSTSTSMFKFPSVSENHESSVEGTTTIDIEPFDSLDDYQNRRNINEVPYITVTAPSNEGEHQKLGGTPPHEAVRSKSSNAVEKLLESEHVDVELLDERSYKARKYISDEETAKLFIKYYDGKIDNLSKKVADSSRNLTRAKYVLWAAKFVFASLGALGSIDVYRSYYTGDSTNKIFALFVGSAGAVLFINTCLDAGLSYFEGKNSIVKEELRNCIEERYKVEKNLYDLQQKEAFPHTRAGLAAPRTFQAASTSTSVYSPEQRYIS